MCVVEEIHTHRHLVSLLHIKCELSRVKIIGLSKWYYSKYVNTKPYVFNAEIIAEPTQDFIDVLKICVECGSSLRNFFQQCLSDLDWKI